MCVYSRGVVKGKRGGGGREVRVSAGASWIKVEAYKLTVGPSTSNTMCQRTDSLARAWGGQLRLRWGK
jgi:hypothetical protein